MNSIPFCKAVRYGTACNSFGQSLLEKVDDYFFLKGRKVQVILGHRRGNREGVVDTAFQRSSAVRTALKVASYCTVVIPLIALLAKVVLRCVYKFYKIPTSSSYLAVPPKDAPSKDDPPTDLQFPPSYLGDDPSQPSSDLHTSVSCGSSLPVYLELPLNTPTTLSCEGVVKLKIRMTTELLQDGSYVCEKGFSDLPVYKDSWFECTHVRLGKYVVTRRKLSDRPYRALLTLEFDKPTTLSSEQIAKLRIRPVAKVAMRADGSAVSVVDEGFSDLPLYRDSIFHFKMSEDAQSYVITRKLSNDSSTYIPIRKATRLSPKEFMQLKMDHGSMNCSKGWVSGASKLFRYTNSRFVWKEEKDGVVLFRC